MKSEPIKSSEITPRGVYLNRRLFMQGAALAVSTAATGLLYKQLLAPAAKEPAPESIREGATQRREGSSQEHPASTGRRATCTATQ